MNSRALRADLAFVIAGLPGQAAPPAVENAAAATAPCVATFSIVARDPDTWELGVAVQSRVLGVGAIVPFAMAGVGAIATQAMANTAYGPEGLKLLAGGKSAAETIAARTAADPQRDIRQAGIIAVKGEPAGSGCLEYVPVNERAAGG